MAQPPISHGEHTLREALCRALRRARLQKGIRQVEVADRLRVPQSFVSKYEAGQRTLDFIETLQVCRVLGITLENLLVLFEMEQEKEGTP